MTTTTCWTPELSPALGWCTVPVGADDGEWTTLVLSVQRLHTAEPRPSVAPRGSRRVMLESLFLLLLKLWPMSCFDLPRSHTHPLALVPRGHTLVVSHENHLLLLNLLLLSPHSGKADYADKSIPRFPNTRLTFARTHPSGWDTWPALFRFFFPSPLAHSQTNGPHAISFARRLQNTGESSSKVEILHRHTLFSGEISATAERKKETPLPCY